MSISEIYEPAEDSFLLQKYVRKHAFGKVLDMGTGSGIQAKTAAENVKVKNVLAVDINQNAIDILNAEIKNDKLIKKIKTKTNDLFSNIDEKFDTIIFNPPYLPQDKIAGKPVEDPALYGGKKGYELLEKFFEKVGDYLTKDGIILILFSSLTKKDKVDEFIQKHLYHKEHLAQEKLPFFETLYVYKIEQENIRKKLIALGVKDLNFFAKGHRGLVYKGLWDRNSLIKTHFAKKEEVDVAIKIVNPQSKARERLVNETKWLKVVNKKGMGPKLYYYKPDFLILEFINGIPLPKFIETETKKEGKNSKKVKDILTRLLEQAFILDKLKINKEEMHRPNKNVLVTKDNKVILLDFERCYESEKPRNVTQFCSFLIHQDFLEQEKGKDLSQDYKKSYSEDVLELIKEELRVNKI